jgi:hypothetical protein
MQTWLNKLISTINSLQSQNNYWTTLYGYVEQGLANQLAEMETLRLENKQLRVRVLYNPEQLLTVKENRLSSSSVKTFVADVGNLPPQIALQIQRLGDQVRGRDLVIELLFARLSSSNTERADPQQETSEEQMQKTLALHRRRLESEFGLLVEAEGAEKQRDGEQLQNARRIGKRSREPGGYQSSRVETALKRPKINGNENFHEAKFDSLSGISAGVNSGAAGKSQDDDEAVVEQALEEAFDELDQDIVNDELEDLFTDST